MTMTLNAIVEEAVQLPEDVVAELIERIIVGHHGGIPSDVDAAWQKEVRQRVTEINEGQVTGIPLAESLARAARVLQP